MWSCGAAVGTERLVFTTVFTTVSLSLLLYLRRCGRHRETCYMAKETYLYGKRDLLIWQKRPTYMAKETYPCGKRVLTTLA